MNRTGVCVMENKFRIQCLFFLIVFGFLISFAYADSPWSLHIIDNSFSGADGVHLFDIDGDGFQDAVVGWEESGKVILYKNPGSRKVKKKWKKHPLFPTGYFSVCDMGDDFDGFSIVAPVGTSSKNNTHTAAKLIQLRFEDGVTQYTLIDIVMDKPLPKDKPAYVTKGIACGDLNNNGLVDLVFSFSGHGVGVFAALAQSRDFSRPWKLVDVSSRKYNHFSKGIKHDNIELVDIDGDGDLDIVTTEENGGTFLPNGLGLIWFENSFYK